MEKPRIFLASKSERRKELLKQLGLPFETLNIDIDETPLHGERPELYAKRISLWKSLNALAELKKQNIENAIVICADTSVVLDHQIFGKPKDFADFKEMMKMLSGKTHQVLSSLCVANHSHKETALSISEVTFAELTDKEIFTYWQSKEPEDKAGGYAVQGQAAAFISTINGSYSGIVGLPLFELNQALKAFNLSCFENL